MTGKIPGGEKLLGKRPAEKVTFTKKVCESEVEGKRDRGRPCIMGVYRVKKAYNARSL